MVSRPPDFATSVTIRYAPSVGPHGQQRRGATIDDLYYVQVHYPRGRQWVTVAMAETRETASKLAANAFFGLRNGRGDTPRTCRVASGAQLVREGGQREIRHADAEIARRPQIV
jgi:hypothetical protein